LVWTLLSIPFSSFRRRPDNGAQRVEQPQAGPQGERSESSRKKSKHWTPAFAGVPAFIEAA
jgi:hypothetical protein